jgi:predicted DNA-binding antitoxin AbrB/MazE fold protein
MTKTIQAIYEGGVFKPREPVTLAEGAAVELTVRTKPEVVGADPVMVLRMVEEIAAMPAESPDDGFSAADHDKILYGGTDARGWSSWAPVPGTRSQSRPTQDTRSFFLGTGRTAFRS